MTKTLRTLLPIAAALAAAAGVCAQTQPAPAQPASVPAYRSAFEGYKPFEAGEAQDWRQSNDTVRAIGGWRAYAREIQGGAAPSPATAPAAAPADGAHQGHHP